MKKMILILGLMLSIASHSRLDAQIVRVNISSQPLWGPVGYNYVEYYYIPGCEVYYYVPGATFHYFSGGVWLSATSLPAAYGCDLYSSYKVVINRPKPWLHHHTYVVKYAKYKSSPPRQYVIRDSDDPKYYVVQGHRNYKQENQTGVKTGDKPKEKVTKKGNNTPSKEKIKKQDNPPSKTKIKEHKEKHKSKKDDN